MTLAHDHTRVTRNGHGGVYDLEMSRAGLTIWRLGTVVADVLIGGTMAMRINDHFKSLGTVAERNAYIDGVIAAGRLDADAALGKLVVLRDNPRGPEPLELMVQVGDRCLVRGVSYNWIANMVSLGVATLAARIEQTGRNR
jgi:hypothetical protein